MRKSLIIAPLFAVFIFGPAAYLLTDRQNPYEYLLGEVLPPNPTVGGQISVHWKIKVHRYCPGWVQRTITDSRGYNWYNVGGMVRNIQPVSQGDTVDIVNTFDLPRLLGPGVARYSATITYKCNWLQHWIWPIIVKPPVLEFEIH